MANILAVGIATLDIINTVESYPAEDEEVRALSQRQARGGNATNTLVVLSQLGHHGCWAGVIIDEPDVQLIKQDLASFNIDFSACTVLNSGKMPTSYISLSKESGSRTIVHHRDCPEFSFTDFQKIDLQPFDWVHFEGRNVDETLNMFKWLKQHYPDLPFSLEVEKPRANIESLFDYPHFLMFSQQYALAKGYETASALLQALPTTISASCTWGELGAWAINNANIVSSPAYPPANIVDTLGAGDTFNAGLISALLQQKTIKQALTQACQLAGHKCGQLGFANLING
ncbi:ketohexokinase [Methylophaga sp. 42_25_T18]|nr:ketohexokinase [Methylophaga sp. 42_25_T18]